MFLLTQEAIMIKSAYAFSFCLLTIYMIAHLIVNLKSSPKELVSLDENKTNSNFMLASLSTSQQHLNTFTKTHELQSRENLIYFGANTTMASQFNTESMIRKYTNPDNPAQLRRFPQVICVGVIKSGTDALSAFLELHPEIARCPGEAMYFHRQSAGTDYEEYLRKMPYSDRTQYTYEKSPMYATGIDHETVNRIYRYDPAVKILFIVREPITRSMSSYLHRFGHNPAAPSFEDLCTANGTLQSEAKIITDSVYERHIRPWISRFSREQVHVVDGDRLISNPVEEMYKVETFLNIEHFLDDRILYFNETKGFFCFRDGPEGNNTCLPKHKGKTQPPIDPTVRDMLIEFYKPYNKLFSELVNQTFSWIY